MENRIVFKNREIVKQDSNFLGIAGENEQEILIFSFEDRFIDGACFLELELPDGKNHLIRLEKNNECYQLIVKKSLLKLSGIMKMQLKLISNVTEIWKSSIFEMPILKAINVTDSIADDYPDLLVMMQEMEVGLEQVNERTKDLRNYDDTEIKKEIEQVKKDVEAIETFSGDYDDLENKPDSVSDNDIDKFFRFEQFYRVDVIGGYITESQKTEDGWYSKGMSITVVANEAPIGKKFGWWKVLKGADESKVGSSNYSFSLYSDTVLEAVFVDEEQIVEHLISITLEANLNKHATKGDCVRLYSSLMLPTVYKKLDFGILVCFDESTELRLNNEGIGKFPARPTNISYAYNYPISDCEGKVLRSKAFVTFEKDGATETMYSSELRIDVDLEYAAYQELLGGGE